MGSRIAARHQSDDSLCRRPGPAPRCRSFGTAIPGLALVSPLPVPDRPEHHYRYDPPKAQFYVVTTLSWLGDTAAESIARQVLAAIEAPGLRPRWAIALLVVRASLPGTSCSVISWVKRLTKTGGLRKSLFTAATGRRAVGHPPQSGFHWRRGFALSVVNVTGHLPTPRRWGTRVSRGGLS
jgi:hypothetical protein